MNKCCKNVDGPPQISREFSPSHKRNKIIARKIGSFLGAEANKSKDEHDDYKDEGRFPNFAIWVKMAYREASDTQHFLQSFRRRMPPTSGGRRLSNPFSDGSRPNHLQLSFPPTPGQDSGFPLGRVRFLSDTADPLARSRSDRAIYLLLFETDITLS